MQRRDALIVLGGVAIAAPAKLDIANYKPRFFTAAEYALVDELTELLLPEDGTPGARAAGVRYYIDTVLLYSDASAQRLWRDGLAAAARDAESRAGKPLGSANASEKNSFMEKWAGADSMFFRVFKGLTIEAYGHSDVAQRLHFGYKGNHAVHHFTGCQEDHQA